ncbi:hypothetical protein [Bacillus cereus]|uniref:hypothetical protein n=1 Tax=Bacillus cereus TaxID=1396 RepID=UPI000B4C0063|nr:hypothetical protein [Bacillus cereus]
MKNFRVMKDKLTNLNFKKYRKKGDIFLLSLFYFLFITLIFAIFVSLSLMSETFQRAQNSAETGARTRALAVNVPLKEQYGIVDAFRLPVSEGYKVNYKEPPYSIVPSPGYDLAVLDPASTAYKLAYSNADSAAKHAVIESINSTLGSNEAGKKIIDLKPENICVQVLPLPKGGSITKKDKLDFKCNATVNGKAVTISADNVEVYGTDHNTNNAGNLKVHNVVFVGVAYEDHHFFYKLFQRMAHGEDESNWDAPPVRRVWAIAYPQLDACTGSEC